MKKSKKTNAIKKQLVLSISLIVSLLIVTVSATYSWFLYQRPNEAYDINVEVSEAYNLHIKNGTVLGEGIQTNFHPDFRLQPVAGNGRNFQIPQYEEVEVSPGSGVFIKQPIVDQYQPLNDAQIQSSVFTLNFIMAVDSYVDLYLEYTNHDRTYVSMGLNPNDRLSPYGGTQEGTSFSRDHINGAVRLAIFQNDVLKCIWIPNPQVELIKTPTYSLNTQGNVEETYKFLNPDGTMLEIETNGATSGNVVEEGVVYIWGDISETNCPPITSMYGEHKFKIVMWIEGTDRECDNALVGGKVRLNLCFSAKAFGTTQEE